MVKTCFGPSELHLKKELTALRSSRLLRDPETCSSWRSPLSSRSVTSTANLLKNKDAAKRKTLPTSSSDGPDKVNFDSQSPLQSENRRRKAYLYNWGNSSRKSNEDGTKLDVDTKVEVSPTGSVNAPSDPEKVTTRDNFNNKNPISFLTDRGSRGESLDASVQRTERVRQKNMLKAKILKNTTVSDMLYLPPNALDILNSTETLHGTEYSNSEDLPQSVKELTQKDRCVSQSASPLFSVSGCGHWSDSSKMIRNSRREDSSYSYTPVSTSSYNRFGEQNTSTVGSWDETLAFDEDNAEQMDLPAGQVCGLPCYSSKRKKDRGRGGWCSPSFSDTLRRKGSRMLCGSQMLNHMRKSSVTHKRKVISKPSHGLPLLTNSCDQGRSSAETESDELSTIMGELDLEALSRLDGSRWSNCKSEDVIDLAVLDTTTDAVSDNRSLSQKHRPFFFDEVVGQNLVVQSLHNAILRGRIAPAYLFQGSRGTGKTSIARIFSAALNCLTTDKNKPCGLCRECTDFASGKCPNVREMDAANKKGPDLLKYLLEKFPTDSNFSGYRVFVIEECHLLNSEMWSAFTKFLEDPPYHVVFIFITTDPDSLPHAVVSRCQKYMFPKIKDSDVVDRLQKLSSHECLDIEVEALDLIASNSNGSLRDAETTLDQLSLLGKTITASLVNDLVGIVSDDKLLDLLEIAMSADSAETVRKSREILDSGIDPTRLTSQLAGLIMDIIAGTHQLVSLKSSDIALWGRRLTESELDRLQQALKILSDAEKQLRHSCEQSTWFTAALLQLGSGHSVESADSSGSCSKHNIPDVSSYRSPGFMLKFQHSNSSTVPGMLSQHSSPHVAVSDVPSRENSNNRGNSQSKVESNSRVNLDCGCPEKLEGIWKECIVGCHSKSLRTLLSAHGKLVSISEVEGVLVANVTFQDASTKSRGERFLSSITNSFENLLKRNVKVQIGFSSDSYMDKEASQELSKYAVGDGLANVKGERESGDVSHYLTSSQKHTVNLLREDIDMAESRFEGSAAPDESVSVGSVPNFNRRQLDYEKNGKRLDIPVQISVAATSGQHFECTWQASDKTTAPGSADKQKLESNKVLPQNGFICHKHNIVTAVTSKHWEDELNLEFEALKINDGQAHLKEENAEKIPQFPIASSPLHNDINTSSIGEEHIGYDSAPGCSGLLCWQHHRTKIGTKVKRINRIKSKRQNQISCLGRRTSTKSSRSRLDH